MRVLVATDAWHPQVNGVVRTLTSLATQQGDHLVVSDLVEPDAKGFGGAQVRQTSQDDEPDVLHHIESLMGVGQGADVFVGLLVGGVLYYLLASRSVRAEGQATPAAT